MKVRLVDGAFELLYALAPLRSRGDSVGVAFDHTIIRQLFLDADILHHRVDQL
jgi:hypothetical protein